MQGQLGEKLISDLIRELARKKANGLLRLSRGKTIKAIFFESGAPVFAISNITTEQLEHKLVKDGLVTFDQIEQAKQRAEKANRLGLALVEMGLLTDEVMRKAVREQVMSIICSLFEWYEGEYMFDERMRAVHDVTLDIAVHDVLLEGARRAAGIEEIAQIIAPPEGVIVRTRSNGISMDAGKLVPVESYVLSRIVTPTAISEVSALSGLGEQDAHRAVCALMAAGLLKLLNDEREQKEGLEPEQEEDLERLRQEVKRKTHFFRSADFYEVLGVTRQSSAGEIKASYYQLAKKFHPDRYRQLDDAELHNSLESMFAKITQAYETLSQPGQRAAYDEQIRKASKSPSGNPAPSPVTHAPPIAQKPPIAQTPPVAQKPPVAQSPPVAKKPPSAHIPPMAQMPSLSHLPPVPATTPLRPIENRKSSGDLGKPDGSPEKAAHSPDSSKESGGEVNLPPGGVNLVQAGEQYYQQGRALFEKKEYHKAVHLLREAIRMDPSRPQYHFHLGLALVRNPRTRHEAERHLSKAAELDPYSAQIRLKLGMLYKEIGMPKKAENYFKAALVIDPENRVAKRELKGAGAKAEGKSFWKADLGSIKRLFKK
ncbi:MAG: DnaJ domain-containing protein [Blastocatellia bacterium]|nr:DnaJ domain-containing protein [Blastocatellia bacterium]